MASRSSMSGSPVVRALQRVLTDRDTAAVEAEATWRRYYSGCGFEVEDDAGNAGLTFAGCKVVWKALASGIQACVVDTVDGVCVVPDHNVVLVPLADPEEAHYLCGVLNAPQTTRFANAYTGWFYSTHLLQTFAVPQYNSRSRRHGAIARLSRQTHARPIPAGTAAVQAQLDEAVGSLPGFNTVPDEDLP